MLFFNYTTAVLVFILYLSAATTIVLQRLPRDDSGRVPKVLFEGHPSVFDAFATSVKFAFSGSLIGLVLQNRPDLPRSFFRFCSFYTYASVASAVGLVIWVGFLQDPICGCLKPA